MIKAPIVPTATIRKFEVNQHCADSLPGDLVLVRHHGAMPTIIRTGQRARYFFMRNILRKNDHLAIYCKYNHAMTIGAGGHNATASQMEAKGGRIVGLMSYVSLEYVVVSTTNTDDTQRIAASRFGQWCEGIQYAWFSIFGCVLNVFMPFVALGLANGERMICSTAASLAQRCLGLIPDKCDVSVMPADLARYFDVRT